MDFRHLRYEQDGPVTVITIDRPERMNAIGPDVARELIDAWTRFRDDEAALVGVLTGAGDDAFCAGGDLKAAFEGDVVVPLSREERDAHARGERPGILGPTRWTDLYKPTIAAVNGVAYAGGLEWACWTDLCIADEHATFGVTCRRWNRELAHRIAALPQPAIHTDKEAAVRGFGRPLDEGLRIEAECFDRLIDGPEMAEGLRRFNERDHPDRARSGVPATPGLARPRADGAG
jgi:enoyl-CoA hydratase